MAKAGTAQPINLFLLSMPGVPHIVEERDKLIPLIKSHPEVNLLATGWPEDSEFDWQRADLVVVLGGDGAILRVCRQMGETQRPIVGVNLGHLGFLADLLPEEFHESCGRIFCGDYRIVQHLMYSCRLKRKGETQPRKWLGLNEAAVLAGGSFHMIDVELRIDGEQVTTYSGDGVLISTPVGSTGHSLSAGGPILRQDLQAFVITPICPHSLSMRPVVDTADRVYSFHVAKIPEGTSLVLDGQVHVPLEAEDEIEIRRAPVEFLMAKVTGHSYYATLHRKLNWGGQPNYRTRRGSSP